MLGESNPYECCCSHHAATCADLDGCAKELVDDPLHLASFWRDWLKNATNSRFLTLLFFLLT